MVIVVCSFAWLVGELAVRCPATTREVSNLGVKNILAVLLFLTLAAPAVVQPANAQETFAKLQQITGNKFLEWCRGIAAEQGVCLGYVMGLDDGISILQSSETDRSRWSPICKPKEVTASQVQDVVIKYLDDHPEKRHEMIAILAIVAMRAAWPCPR